ncbi:hypothetical protein ACT7DJ_36490 [Bacillus cereus]
MPTLISAVVNVFCLFLLTNTFGLVGATISLTVAFFINGLIITIKLKKLYNIRLKASVLYGGVATLIISTFVFYYFKGVYLIPFILILTVILIYVFKDILITVVKLLKFNR